MPTDSMYRCGPNPVGPDLITDPGHGRAAMLLECLASGSDTQKNSGRSIEAYQTGETQGAPASSAVPIVMN
jgi:hypothetical protein